MEQAKYFVCTECASPVAMGHKFCGSCGAPVPTEVQGGNTEYFSELQTPGKARLVLIRGLDGAEGLSYSLSGEEHFAGSDDAQILFPDDVTVSPKHARFFYEGDKLMVADEASGNGVFVRITGTEDLDDGQHFICGEQVFVVGKEENLEPHKDVDDTFFYTSPATIGGFRIKQQLEGGIDGIECVAGDTKLTIGREECSLNFPEDIYISGEHAEVSHASGTVSIRDLDSRNGTYVKIKKARQLSDGDYVFIGKQLLRVELN